MKYFEKLPKRNYETTLGSFNISDFFSYYKFNYENVSKKEITIDSKTTLPEAASVIYEDSNSFWLFLLANKWLNPFTLLEDNVLIFSKQNENKNDIRVGANSSGGIDISDIQSSLETLIYIVPGSILLKNTGATSGNPWDYSYVGYFDLNDEFSIVESVNSYSKKITVKESCLSKTIFTNGVTGYKLANINKPEYSNYLEDKFETDSSKTQEIKTTNSTKTLIYQKENFKQEFKDMEKNYPYDEIPTQTSSLPGGDPDIKLTVLEDLKQKNKNIYYFSLNDLSKVTNRLITVKYT